MSAETAVNGWSKYSRNPVLGGALGTCFDMSVDVTDRGLHRMWFSWRPKQGIGYAESPDGLNWTPRKEVVLGIDPDTEAESVDITRPFVMADQGALSMWYSAHSSDEVRICRATSHDGVKWTRQGVVLTPDLPWEKKSVMCPSVLIDEHGGYHMWYSGGERYEPDAIGYATSPNGNDWTRVSDRPVLGPDAGSDWETDRVAGAHVLRHDGWLYAIYIGFANGFEDSAIGVARSADGIDWQRHAENPVLTRGEPGEFDSINVYKPFAIVEDGLWRVWFNGSSPLVGGDRAHDNRIEQIGYASCRFQFQTASPRE